MFKLEKDQLLQLDDTQLRELVARLCEAELLSKSQPSRNVRWGGAQTAPDEGIDVECLVEDDNFIGNFVPRSHTIFQVKVSKMSPDAIKKEMSPTGQLRPIFSKLAKNNGCYIIVSLKDDLTASKQETREEAMRNEVKNIEGSNNLSTKFYGRNDLNNWLDHHPSVQLWVQEKLGLTITGWRDHDRWSMTPSNVDDSFVCGPGVEIILPGKKPKRLDIESGVNEIRELVRNSNDAVRIIGLSGVGKTRIVQALFEENVGKNPLSSSLALYADVGDEVDPKPSKFLKDINAKSHKPIVILDNCSSEAHNNCAKLVASFPNSSQSSVKLITIEYDIREDTPESTHVVRIETNIDDIVDSMGITYKIIKNRYSELGDVNIQRIVRFSDGNARLALALVARVEEREDLSNFSDQQLFKRLFEQRDGPDDNLLRCAEVLALVYSFSIKDDNGVDELDVLAKLVEKSRNDLYRATQALLDRGLVQKRGEWRAVLPHALANRLASQALSNIPKEEILKVFENLESKRLLQSFSRRLGYLHKDEVAKSIVDSWILSKELWHNIFDLNNYDELGLSDDLKLLRNVAPVNPESVLEAIENRQKEIISAFFFEKGLNLDLVDTFVNILISIAYDASLFKKCVNLLAKFVLKLNKSGPPSGNVFHPLCDLFSLYFSGTQAGLDLRTTVIRDFLLSKDSCEQQLGLKMLEQALKSQDWNSYKSFEFGARPRSYGYWPQTQEEIHQWFSQYIDLGKTVATKKNHTKLANQIRDIFAKKLEFLCKLKPLHVDLLCLARSFSEHQPWPEGWQAIQEIENRNNHKSKKQDERNGIDEDSGQENLNHIKFLNKIDKILKPKGLAEEIKAHLSAPLRPQTESYLRAYSLGQCAANQIDVIDDILSELFLSSSRVTYLSDFGKGMAASHSDLQTLWTQLVKEFEATENYGSTPGISSQFPSFPFPKKVREKQRYYGNPELLYGAFEGIYKRDESLAQKILDEAIKNPALRSIIVQLHLAPDLLNCKGAKRLKQALKFKNISLFQFISVGLSPLKILNEEDFLSLMRDVLNKGESTQFVLHSLNSRLQNVEEDNGVPSDEINRFSLCTVLKYLHGVDLLHLREDSLANLHITKILGYCIDKSRFHTHIDIIKNIFKACLSLAKEQRHYHLYLSYIFSVLAEKAPLLFLNTIFLNSENDEDHYENIFNVKEYDKNPLSKISTCEILNWCEEEEEGTQNRLITISDFICPFERSIPENDEKLKLTKQAIALVDKSINPFPILKNFAFPRQIVIPEFTAPEVDQIRNRHQAFKVLLNHEREDVCSAAEKFINCLKKKEETKRRNFNEKRELSNGFE